MNRLALAVRVFWRTLIQPEFALKTQTLFESAPSGPDLRVLAVLQRDGRLVDFLMEEIDAYSDAQIGAAVRDIHRGCRKALHDYLALEPVLQAAENTPISVPVGFDAAAIRLSGNVSGSPPFSGQVKHHGWRVKGVRLPVLPGSGANSTLIAPAEVEIN